MTEGFKKSKNLKTKYEAKQKILKQENSIVKRQDQKKKKKIL